MTNFEKYCAGSNYRVVGTGAAADRARAQQAAKAEGSMTLEEVTPEWLDQLAHG